MIAVPEIALEGVAVAPGAGGGLAERALAAANALVGLFPGSSRPGAVIAASFSNERRFPSLAVEIATALGLPPSTPAFDLQMACSAYPYAIYLAGKFAADLGRKVLVIDGDMQTPLVNRDDHATGSIFSDAVSATLVSAASAAFVPCGTQSHFDFFSEYSTALKCPAAGPIYMDGFGVFTFVATKVSAFLRNFIDKIGKFDFFVPHQANGYMVRQLAKSLGCNERLLVLDAQAGNPGSTSVPWTLAANADAKALAGSRALLAGFGAGYSAAAAAVRIAPDFRCSILKN